MDGHFVPNITIGPPVVACLRKVTRLPLDVPRMIKTPNLYTPGLVVAGLDGFPGNQEAGVPLPPTLKLTANKGARGGVVINPATPVEMLEEILDMVDHVLVMSVN